MTEQSEEGNSRLSGMWFGWAWVLPQLMLLALNFRAWLLVKGDLTATQAGIVSQVCLFEFTLLACGLVGLAGWLLRRHNIGTWFALGALALHAGYLWFFLAYVGAMLPSAVSLWMLPESELIFYQFSLVMPAVFLMLVALARMNTGLSRGAEIGVCVSVLVGVPMAAYIIGMVLSRLIGDFFFSWQHYQYILLFAAIVATALILVAFLKLLSRLYALLCRHSWFGWGLPLLAGLVAPLSGLALNAGIPFPYDLQDLTVYVLTVLNGLALLIPFRKESGWSTAGWALRVIFLPFSLYFFLVFLPFFPLSLIAMIAAGSGILILAPIFLLVVHGRLLLEQGREVVGKLGVRRTAMLAVLCILVMPAGFLLRCENDRRTLGKAIDAVYNPDFRAKSVVVNPGRLDRALQHMDYVKRGIYLPYLTDSYNAIVLRGMVLPDDKADLIRKSLLGDVPSKKRDSMFWGRGFGGGRERNWSPTRGDWVTKEVKMAVPEVTSRMTNEIIEAEVKLTLKNEGGENGEFAALIDVPEGVFVTGFWLDVNGTNKPAHLREKKTAIWVYEMIRDVTRRDPGLLLYKTDSRLALRVYPFTVGQGRTCGMTFRFPATLKPVIRIEDTPVALNPETPVSGAAVSALLPGGDEAMVLSMGGDAVRRQFVRSATAHLILDRSAAASKSTGENARLVKEALSLLPESVQDVRVTWANYEQEDLPGTSTNREEIARLLDQPVSLGFRGGFCPERVIARLLLEEQEQSSLRSDSPAMSSPIFIVVPAPGSTPVKAGGLQAFATLLPDMPAYIVYSNSVWQSVGFDGGIARQVSPTNTLFAPVTAVRKGKAIQLLRAADYGLVIAPAGESTRGDWECWDPAEKAFRAVTDVTPCADATYLAALDLWKRHRAMGFEPARIDAALPGLVHDAQSAGVMVPETAFIVVETASQEVILARKEKQSLEASHNLEFSNVKQAPAPTIIWVIPLVLYFVYRLRRKTR